MLLLPSTYDRKMENGIKDNTHTDTHIMKLTAFVDCNSGYDSCRVHNLCCFGLLFPHHSLRMVHRNPPASCLQSLVY